MDYKNLAIANVLYTHSDYSDVWNVFFEQQKTMNNLFEKNYVFLDKYSEKIPNNYIQILYDDSKNYTQRILDCFAQIDLPKVFMFQHEDMFLYKEPDVSQLIKYFDYINDKSKNIDFIKLIKSGNDISKQTDFDNTLYKISLKSDWIFSIQPSIWNTKRFIELLNHHKKDNIWEFELNAQKTCKKMKINGFYSYDKGEKRGLNHWDNNIYPYVATAIVKGKWNFQEYQTELTEILGKCNINPDIRGKYYADKIYLDQEFDKFWKKIKNGENFAFMRHADGERSIMLGEAVAAQEGNWKSPNYVSKLGKDIYASLMIDEPNAYYAISCPCCDNPAYYWYMSRIKTKNITFSNLWINANFSKFKELFPTLNRDAVLIANHRATGHKIGNLNILKNYEINDDCISFWENEAPDMIQQIKNDFGSQNNILYVVSAGPMSGPIIAELYKNNPNNCYIDFGSAIDIYYRENISRPYMTPGNVYAQRNCWMYNPQITNFDVSVVLNLYKRPENLQLQLDALSKQTLMPKEILLYQDGTSETVKIPDNIKDKFDFIEISPENKGVWARFDFAKRVAKSHYVCVFDDDTIPGSRWLENCMTEMLKQEGLYGTIGIVMKNPQKYPEGFGKNYFRVGWEGNLAHTAEVDFVGHSWFFKKEWLKYLFEAPTQIQQCKLCGEDMSFSYELLKHGIKTFVPPHPKNDLELFGSNPQKAWELGTNKHAISMNENNLNNMKIAVSYIIDDWQTLCHRRKKYVNELEEEVVLSRAGKKSKSFKLFKIQRNETHKILTILGVKIKFKKRGIK